jgi:hypothetical protein
MIRAILSVVFVGMCGSSLPTLTCLQQEVVRIERGEYAEHVDESTENRIEAALRLTDPQWSVTILLHSSQGGRRLLELKQGTLRVTAGITYMMSVADAAKELQFRLHTIQIPRFKRLEGLGDDGYLMTETTLLFRVGRLVVQIDSSDQSVETQTAVAQRIIASVRAGEQIVGRERRQRVS